MDNLAIFASGNGSNFEALAAACADGRISAHVALLVCDRPGAYVIERARKFGIETLVLDPKTYPSKADYEREILARLDAKRIDWICLAGYMRLIGPTLLEAFEDRMINIHPSLLPAYKGAHAIREAFEAGENIYGVTIHLVTSELDGGRILAQERIPYTGRDLDELEQMIHTVEHKLYVETVKKLTHESTH